MAVNTILLDFSVDPKLVKDESQLCVVFTNIENILRDFLGNLQVSTSLHVAGGLLKLYTSDFGTVTTVRIFNNGLVTVNIEYYKEEKQEALFSYEVRMISRLCLSITANNKSF